MIYFVTNWTTTNDRLFLHRLNPSTLFYSVVKITHPMENMVVGTRQLKWIGINLHAFFYIPILLYFKCPFVKELKKEDLQDSLVIK